MFLGSNNSAYDQETRDESLNSQSLPRGSKDYDPDEQYHQLMNDYKKETSANHILNNHKKHNDENQPFGIRGIPVNPRDAKPIKPLKQNFEEIIEQSMKEAQNSTNKAKKGQKKQFLKRSEKSELPNQTKKYNYYANNFEQEDEEPVKVSISKRIKNQIF